MTYYNYNYYFSSLQTAGKGESRWSRRLCWKPDLRPSWDGGGWAGPRDGHDKDQRYMLRGEATW